MRLDAVIQVQMASRRNIWGIYGKVHHFYGRISWHCSTVFAVLNISYFCEILNIKIKNISNAKKNGFFKIKNIYKHANLF
jgi:hypothetical protein